MPGPPFRGRRLENAPRSAELDQADAESFARLRSEPQQRHSEFRASVSTPHALLGSPNMTVAAARFRRRYQARQDADTASSAGPASHAATDPAADHVLV